MTSATPHQMPRLLAAVVRWYENTRQRNALVRELDGTGSDGVRILGELGLSGDDIEHIAAGCESPDLLQRMMATLGVDATEILRTEPMVMRDLERTCSLCDAKGTCRRDLDSGEARDHWQGYCINKVTLEALGAPTDSDDEKR